jgi:hypothetical protein
MMKNSLQYVIAWVVLSALGAFDDLLIPGLLMEQGHAQIVQGDPEMEAEDGKKPQGSAAATTNLFDKWTFSSAPLHKSEIQGRWMGNWDTNTFTTTTVPSAGLLRDATGGNSKGAFYGDNSGLTESFGSVTLTVEVADIHHRDRDYWFEFLGDVGGKMLGEINAFGGAIFIDIEGGGTSIKTELNPGKVFDVDDYTGAISMAVSFTWDFANNTLSYTVNGDGVGYTGSGSSAFSDSRTVAADLSGITNIKSMRVRGNKVDAGEYIDLDAVRIETDITDSKITE